ncbi:hypothetical protein L5515_005900 [Caenorhabditis briggsae]|uniref:UNC93-like protein MFSD11 n=1 Tax=Caenorhabditis briggsae TaxID=6238 RepID=A0AAE9JIT4_CAEBR|nr:hypothetical protein L5515_005900 [Caenorhabditis briggsae]
MFGLSQPTWNICQLGAVFFFNFFSFFTLSALSQTLIESVAETEGINRHAGYYSAFLIYLVFTVGHFVATPIVEIISPKWSIVSGLVGYAMFEAAFLWMNEYFLYFSAACAGFSGSLLWTGQFDYLAQNCQPHTLDRNSSNLWGLSQISLIFGGSYLLILYRFQSGNEFQMPLIRTVILSFLVCTLVSIVIGFFLPKPHFRAERYQVPYLKHLCEIVKISFDRNLLFLLSTFLYTGMELSFYSVVFPTMVSFTKALGNTRDLNAISSIFVGIGNVSGCFALSLLGARVREIGRKKMVLFAAVLHMTCFLLAFLMFPNESPLQPTDAIGYFKPSPYVVLISGFLLGVGDTIFNQQCYTILSDIYDHDKRIEAFAVYRFYQSAASCVVMFYSAQALLKTYIIILSTFCVLATVTFLGIRVPEKYPVTPSAEMLEVKEC